eukprot:5840461-Prymnesium_polylepis.1
MGHRLECFSHLGGAEVVGVATVALLVLPAPAPCPTRPRACHKTPRASGWPSLYITWVIGAVGDDAVDVRECHFCRRDALQYRAQPCRARAIPH